MANPILKGYIFYHQQYCSSLMNLKGKRGFQEVQKIYKTLLTLYL